MKQIYRMVIIKKDMKKWNFVHFREYLFISVIKTYIFYKIISNSYLKKLFLMIHMK